VNVPLAADCACANPTDALSNPMTKTNVLANMELRRDFMTSSPCGCHEQTQQRFAPRAMLAWLLLGRRGQE
jgi:hypothetical protein